MRLAHRRASARSARSRQSSRNCGSRFLREISRTTDLVQPGGNRVRLDVGDEAVLDSCD